MTKKIFANDFAAYACIGDEIECRVSLGPFYTGLRLVATIHADMDTTEPDKRDEGFWPSLDPNSCGYIGPKSQSTLRREMAKAENVMKAWRADEWCYVGISVRAWFDDIPLTDEFSNAVWGIEMNYPNGRKGNANIYLRDVADECAYECIREAVRKLTEMVESAA